MRLPKNKPLKAVSPSTFMTWSLCNYKVYLTRLAGLEYIPPEQSEAAAIGSLFDAYLKHYIAKKRGLKANFDELVKSNVKTLTDKVMKAGRYCAEEYINRGCAKRILDAAEVAVDCDLMLVSGGIPINGILDVSVNRVPLDFKVRGFTQSTVYPTTSWTMEFETNGMTTPNMKVIQALEHVAVPWAQQMVFYNWLLRNASPHDCYIHELVMTKNGLRIVEHASQISEEFISVTRQGLEKMWGVIGDDPFYIEMDSPSPSHRLCNMYNVTCEAAPHCHAYKRMVEDATR